MALTPGMRLGSYEVTAAPDGTDVVLRENRPGTGADLMLLALDGARPSTGPGLSTLVLRQAQHERSRSTW